MNISHDSVNRFLNRESYDGRDLVNEVSPLLNLSGGSLSVDVRFSNLTYRGVLTNGPYAFTRHPAYLSKNLFWWCASMP